MPIYEYACPACGAIFEKIQRTQAACPHCPTCHHVAERVVSRPAATGNRETTTPGCGSGGFS